MHHHTSTKDVLRLYRPSADSAGGAGEPSAAILIHECIHSISRFADGVPVAGNSGLVKPLWLHPIEDRASADCEEPEIPAGNRTNDHVDRT